MNLDQEQEIIRVGRKLEKITQNDISVLRAALVQCLLWVGFNKNASSPNFVLVVTQNEEEVLDLLRTLQGCTMSLDVLQVRLNLIA